MVIPKAVLPREIGADSVKAAIKVATFIVPHQTWAFEAMLGGRTWGDARRILDWAKHVHKSEFSRREARRAFSRAVQTSAECDGRTDAALRLLLSMGKIVLKEQEATPGKRGRPHSPVYVITSEGT